MKRFLVQLICVVCLSASAQENIDELFELKWKSKVGQTSFRTALVFENNVLYVPSNGLKSGISKDTLDGLHGLDPLTGEHLFQRRLDISPTQDCNGVAIDENKEFFASESGIFYCYQDGKILWEANLNYYTGKAGMQENDVEGVPILADLNGDSIKDVVFNVESVGLHALDGSNGEELWKFAREENPGDFMNSPLAIDLNDDGIKDFVFGGKREYVDSYNYTDYRNSVFAINGKTGIPLWEFTTNTNMHGSPMAIEVGNEWRIIVAESYSDVTIINDDGRIDRFINLNALDGSISGLFASPVISRNGVLIIGTSWWGSEDGIWICQLKGNFKEAGDGLIELNNSAKTFVETGRVSSTAVIADVLKKPKGLDFIVCTENGELLIFSSEGVLSERVKLPSGVEATPLVADIDNDGNLELIIACLDGFVYCYDTRVKTKKGKSVYWPSFRGPNNNGYIQLDEIPWE